MNDLELRLYRSLLRDLRTQCEIEHRPAIDLSVLIARRGQEHKRCSTILERSSDIPINASVLACQQPADLSIGTISAPCASSVCGISTNWHPSDPRRAAGTNIIGE